MSAASRRCRRSAAYSSARRTAATLAGCACIESTAQDVRYARARASAEPRVHGRSDPVARARHRREHHHLLRSSTRSCSGRCHTRTPSGSSSCASRRSDPQRRLRPSAELSRVAGARAMRSTRSRSSRPSPRTSSVPMAPNRWPRCRRRRSCFTCSVSAPSWAGRSPRTKHGQAVTGRGGARPRVLEAQVRWRCGMPRQAALGERWRASRSSASRRRACASGCAEPDICTHRFAIDPAKPDAIGSSSFQCYGRLSSACPSTRRGRRWSRIASALARQLSARRGIRGLRLGAPRLPRRRRPLPRCSSSWASSRPCS